MELKSFNLINFFYSSNYQKSIDLTEVTNQQYLEKIFFRQAKEIEKNYIVRNAEIKKEIIKEKIISNSNYEKIISDKNVNGIAEFYNYFRNGLSNIKTSRLNFSQDSDLYFLTYIMSFKNAVTVNRQSINILNLNSSKRISEA